MKVFGITHILVAATNTEIPFPNDFIYEHIEIEDTRDEDISKYFEMASKFISSCLNENENNRVLVHWWAGKSRSPILAAAYLVRFHKIKAKHALSMI